MSAVEEGGLRVFDAPLGPGEFFARPAGRNGPMGFGGHAAIVAPATRSDA